MKSFFKGLLMMGAATLLTVGSSVCGVSAATVPVANVKVDFAHQELTITKGTDTKIYIAASTVSTNKKTNVTTVKTAAATEYDVTSAGITADLSSFAVTKDNYITIWGNKSQDKILVKLPAAKTKLKATVNAADITVNVADVTDKNNPADVSGIEYCTTNGTWKDYTANGDLSKYADLGATLRFRVKATAAPAALGKTAETIGQDAAQASIQAYVPAGNYASNELKVKIAKTAAGPKATIDYNNRTVKIPVGSQYRTYAQTSTALVGASAYKPAVADTLANGKEAKIQTLSVDSSDLLNVTTKAPHGTAIFFDLRTAKVDGKKPASKITEYAFNAIGETVTVAKTGKAPVATGATITDVSESAVSGSGAANAAGYADPLVSCTKVAINSKSSAATVTLMSHAKDTNVKYQVVVVDNSATPTAPAADAKVTATITSNAKGDKVTNVKAKSGQLIYIRKMGDAKTGEWATPYVFLGKVSNTYPAS